MRIRLVAIALGLLLNYTDASAQTRLVRIAGPSWPPYFAQDLPGSGISARIIKAAFAARGYETEFVFHPWPRVLKEVAAGEIDAAAPAYFSPERLTSFAYSEHYLNGDVVFLARRELGIGFWYSLGDLRKYRIGIVRGYVNAPEFDSASYITRDPVPYDALNIKKMKARRIDIAIMDRRVAQYLLRTKFPEMTGSIRILSPILIARGQYVMFSRKVTDYLTLLEVFNSGLRTIQNSGSLNSIQRDSFESLPGEL